MASTMKGAAVFLAVAMVVAGAVPGAYAQGEPRPVQHAVDKPAPQADPLCLLIVVNDVRTRAARAALAAAGSEEEAVALYRARLPVLIERSPLRVIREKLGPDPSPEALVAALDRAAMACPAWAKRRAADPKVRGPLIRSLARGRGAMLALGLADMIDHGAGGGGREAGRGLDLDWLMPDAGLTGALMVAVGGFLNAAAASAGRAGVPSEVTRLYESLGQAMMAAGTLMIGLDLALGGTRR